MLDPSTTATKCARILAPSFATEFYQRVQEWFHSWTIIVLNKTCVTRCSVIINLWRTNVSFGLPNDLTEIRRFPHLTFTIFSSGGIIFSFLGGRTYLRTEASHLKVCGLEFGEELSPPLIIITIIMIINIIVGMIIIIIMIVTMIKPYPEAPSSGRSQWERSSDRPPCSALDSTMMIINGDKLWSWL